MSSGLTQCHVAGLTQCHVAGLTQCPVAGKPGARLEGVKANIPVQVEPVRPQVFRCTYVPKVSPPPSARRLYWCMGTESDVVHCAVGRGHRVVVDTDSDVFVV